MSTPQKGHVITTIVFGAESRAAAKLAVLSAFARRQPDGCEFYVIGETKAIRARLREGKGRTDLGRCSINQIRKQTA